MDLMYDGLQISELSMLREFVDRLPSEISGTVDQYLNDLLVASSEKQFDCAKKLVDCLLTKLPKTLDQFFAYVAFSVALSLINVGKPFINSFALIGHVFDNKLDGDIWGGQNLMITASNVAQIIWKICVSKLSNIRHIVTIIGCKEPLPFVTSMLLLSVAMKTSTLDVSQRDVKVFNLYEQSELLELLQQVNAIDDSKQRMRKLYDFMASYSLYQSMVYLREPSFDGDEMFQTYFQTDRDALTEFQNLFKVLIYELNTQILRQHDMESIALLDFIEFSISPGNDELLDVHKRKSRDDSLDATF